MRIKISFLFLFFIVNVFSQSSDFTQLTTNLIYSNPAYAGTKSCPRIYLNYRNKYMFLNRSYVDYYASYDQYLSLIRADVAVTMMNNTSGKGIMKNTFGDIILAKPIFLNEKTILKAGIQIGTILENINTDKVRLPDMYDPVYGLLYTTRESLTDNTQWHLDLGAGILMYSDKSFLGIAMHHINEPNANTRSLTELYSRKFSFQAGTSLNVNKIFNEKIKQIFPCVFINNQSSVTTVNAGFYTTYDKILGWLWIKQNMKKTDSFSILVGFIQKKYKFAYNCDINFLKANSRFGTHEFSLTLYADCKDKKKRPKAINCPGI